LGEIKLPDPTRDGGRTRGRRLRDIGVLPFQSLRAHIICLSQRGVTCSGWPVAGARTTACRGGRVKEDLVTHPQAALPAESGHWWALALRGAIAILFGLAALLRPGIALEALILLFGAYALVDGVFSIVGVFGGTRSRTPRWLLLVEGVAGILAGVIAFVFPILTAVVFLYLIVAWAIVTGIAEIATAIRLRQEIQGEWALIVGGILSVLFGVLLGVLGPFAGILSLIWLIGAYSIAFGVLLLVTAVRVRGQDDQEGQRPRRVV
jgi:uncharacterized membrane protein HdeD (DUF308 family)